MVNNQDTLFIDKNQQLDLYECKMNFVRTSNLTDKNLIYRKNELKSTIKNILINN